MPETTKLVTAEIIEDDVKPAETFEITSAAPGATIETNYQAYRAYLEELLEPYRGEYIIADDADAKVVKAQRTKLNNIRKSLDEQRLEKKREYTEPLVAFEALVKKLTEPILEVTESMGAAVSQYEQGLKDTKKSLLRSYYIDIAGDLAESTPFDTFMSSPIAQKHDASKWLNKTYSEMTARDNIVDAIREVASNERTINALDLEEDVRISVLSFYRATLDFEKALNQGREEHERRERIKRQEAERLERLAESRKAAESRTKPEPAQLEQTPENKREQPTEPQPGAESTAPRWYCSFQATREQAQAVAAALKEIGITGGVLTPNRDNFYKQMEDNR